MLSIQYSLYIMTITRPFWSYHSSAPKPSDENLHSPKLQSCDQFWSTFPGIYINLLWIFQIPDKLPILSILSQITSGYFLHVKELHEFFSTLQIPVSHSTPKLNITYSTYKSKHLAVVLKLLYLWVQIVRQSDHAGSFYAHRKKLAIYSLGYMETMKSINH